MPIYGIMNDMKKQKYYTKNIDGKWEEVPYSISNDVIRQYIEHRYTGALLLATFIIGFLCGVVAYAI